MISSESEVAQRGIIWVRYAFGILCMIGMSLIFTMRQSTDVAIWNHGSIAYGEDILSLLGNEQLISISYFFGYVVFQPVAGRLAELHSAKWVLWSGCLVYVILHCCTPVAMKMQQIYVMLTGRFISGVSSAVMYPAMAVLIARWTPPSDRFTMCGLIYGGFYLGSAISLFGTAWILSYAKYDTALYLEAGCTVVWLLSFAVYARDYPQQSSIMTKKECDLIVSSLRDSLYAEQQAKRSRIPLGGIFTSRPFYALLVIQISLQLVFSAIMFRISFALHTFHWKSNIEHLNRALLVASPFYWCTVMSITIGIFFHTMNEEKAITPTKALRFSAIVSCIFPLICLPIDYFIQHAGELCVKPVLLIVQAGFHAMIMANHIFISPNYAGTLVGLTNGFSTVCGVGNGFFLEHGFFLGFSKRSPMAIVYGITAIFSFLAMGLYCLLVSTKVQTWNNNYWEVQITTEADVPRVGQKK